MTHHYSINDAEPILPEGTREKLSKLYTLLDDQSDSSSLRTKDNAVLISPRDISHQLFQKASPAFLSSKTLEELETIVSESLTAIKTIYSGSEEVFLHAVNWKLDDNTPVSRIIIAEGDRPFIINSITECTRELGLHIVEFLHPIFLVDGFRLSLACLEIRNVSEESMLLLSRRIRDSLEDLKLITDDFTSMIVHTETIGRILANPRHSAIFPQSERKEVAEFIHWLSDDGFIFLGYAEWPVEKETLTGDIPAEQLGMFRSNQPYCETLIRESQEDVRTLLASGELIHISKLRTKSLIHRRSRVNHIGLLEISSDGHIIAVHSLVGMFTSRALAQESSSVPLIRKKLESLIEAENVYENSYDYKTMVNIIDSMPKDESFRMSTEGLRDLVHSIMGIQNKNDTRVSIRFDSARRGVSILLVLPRDRFNTQVRDKLQSYIESVFRARPGTSEYHLDLTNRPHARLYFYIPIPEGDPPSIKLEVLEEDIARISRTWNNNLEEHILKSLQDSDPIDLWFHFQDAFPEDYQALQSVEDAAQDINIINELSEKNYLHVALGQQNSRSKETYTIIVYRRNHELTLSHTLPVLQNAGFEVLHEQSSCVSPRSKAPVFVHRFQVKPIRECIIDPQQFEAIVSPGLTAVFKGQATDDILNSLMLFAGLTPDIIKLLRSYSNLLWQVTKLASRLALYECLATQSWAAQELWNIFDSKFNPDHDTDTEARLLTFQKHESAFTERLRDVSSITNDRILRSLLSLLAHTVRTNFYQHQDTIVLKLRSDKIDIMPHPRPMYEIFIDGYEIQGTHLRSGPIARGGLRWSERPEDFRHEVLGLMKTQKVKNSLIVPEGAKGGFIVHNLPDDHQKMRDAVESGYKTYIRSLLQITDNRVDGEVVQPDRCVIYDGKDPYLVVAADKGTATYSDLANQIATEEFNFWLGDAFASGGSNGYDHKLYGITARGAWESVIRHFKDRGLNYENDPFTVVGIGDMSGDVFGNGLLYSRHCLLIAAFNHKHIFVDPTPDAQQSFEERKRLFSLPRSQWSDYDDALISEGGGVFGRFDKEIPISKELRSALQLGDAVPSVLNGEQLISYILRAEVDLLWNGGIGTYVKSKLENNAEVNDGTNDRVRINANELRASVVGEGGNLGFTQQARIEFAERGGYINTDAIDNSGGVDLSDHEVNLKVLFADLMKAGKLSLEHRNQLLLDIAPSVVEDVLNHNKNHAFILSIGFQRSRRNIAYFRTLISEVSELGFIDRGLEYLPDDEELTDRMSKGEGLSKPELAICLGAMKMYMKSTLMKSELPKDPLLKSYLLDYFPQELRDEYREDILAHPLGHQIISTQVSNMLVDSSGITFIHRMCVNNSVMPITVMKCMLAAHLILDLSSVQREALRFDTFEQKKTFVELRKELSSALREATSWLITYYGNALTLQEMVELFQPAYRSLLDSFNTILKDDALETFEARCAHYKRLGMHVDAGRSLAAYPHSVQSFELLWAANKSSASVHAVATTREHVLDALGVRAVLSYQQVVRPKSKWEIELLINSYEDIYRGISRISVALLDQQLSDMREVTAVLRSSISFAPLQATLEELGEKNVNPAAISVIAKQLRTYAV